MVKITYREWEEIVIHEILEEESQNLYLMLVQQMLASGAAGMTPALNWVDGIVFTFGLFHDTPEVIKDKLKGILHFAVVNFARVPTYQPVVTVIVKNNSYQIRLDRIKNNKNFTALAQFLKGMKKESD